MLKHSFADALVSNRKIAMVTGAALIFLVIIDLLMELETGGVSYSLTEEDVREYMTQVIRETSKQKGRKYCFKIHNTNFYLTKKGNEFM